MKFSDDIKVVKGEFTIGSDPALTNCKEQPLVHIVELVVLEVELEFVIIEEVVVDVVVVVVVVVCPLLG